MNRRALLAATGAASTAALSGCLDTFSDSTPDRTTHSDHAISNSVSGATARWPVPRQNPRSTAALSGTVVEQATPAWTQMPRRVEWALTTESTVVVVRMDGEFTAYDIDTGEERWSPQRDSLAGRPLAILDNDLLVLLDEPRSPKTVATVALETGTVARRTSLATEQYRFYTATDDTLFLGSGVSTVETRNVATGERVYTVDFSRDDWLPSETNVVEGATVGDEQLYVSVSRCEDDVSCTGGTLHALDLATGKLNWEVSTDDGNVRAPTVGDGAVYVTDSAGLHARSPTDGHRLWSVTDDGVVDGVVALHDWLFVGGDDLVAIDTGGTIRWRYTESRGVQTPPTVVGDHVLVADYDDVLYRLSATTGAVTWRYRLSDDESFRPYRILSNGARTVVYGDDAVVAF